MKASYHSTRDLPKPGRAAEIHMSLLRYASEQQRTYTAASLGHL